MRSSRRGVVYEPLVEVGERVDTSRSPTLAERSRSGSTPRLTTGDVVGLLEDGPRRGPAFSSRSGIAVRIWVEVRWVSVALFCRRREDTVNSCVIWSGFEIAPPALAASR